MSHFSETVSPRTSFWELGLGLLGVRVLPRGKLGFHDWSKVLEKWSWRSGVQPN